MVKHKKFTRILLVILLPALIFSTPDVKAAKTQADSAQISSEEFLTSSFATSFKNHQYKKALKELKTLSQKYPNDPLILRYRALTLQKLGRTEEAISIYQKLLSEHPDHAPTRIFLGRARAQAGNGKAAAEQFREVTAGEGKEYHRWAQAELARMRLGAKPPKKKKRFYFVGKGGIAYDSNPLLVPDDETLTRPGTKKRGADYLMNWTAGYAPILEHDARVDILYIGQEVLHNKGKTSKVNFSSQGFAVDGKKRIFFGSQGVLFNGRYDFRANFLRSHLFSISNRFFLAADTSFVKRTRTHVYSRFNILNFGPDGSIPSRTSRDGGRMGFGLTQYFYTPSLKRFLFMKGEFNVNTARGNNFDRKGALARVGIHTPVDFVKKLDCDVSGGFDFGGYPHYESLSRLDLEEREDSRWDVYSALTYHLMPRVALRSFYRWIKSNNQNNFFDRDRHMAGGELIFSI